MTNPKKIIPPNSKPTQFGDTEEAREKYLDTVKFGLAQIKSKELGYIIYRNVFQLINEITFLVIIFLYVFGDHQAALFLGIVFLINISMGLIQDVNAWVALEKLQLLTAPQVVRIKKDGSEEITLTENIMQGDQIKLKIGDQIPCDSAVISSHSLEINEGLITGESNSIIKSTGDKILAGSVVTSGSGVIQAETIYSESRISRMTEGAKKHTVNLSPIQAELSKLVKYSGYVLMAIIAFIVGRGFLVQEPAIRMVKNIGAMTSLVIPAGLVFAMTLFFAYGAAHLFRRQVLLQEVSATEKLGRIKNLCMDKTGTITENFLTVEKIYLPVGINLAEAKNLTLGYIQGTNDSSQVSQAVIKFVKDKFTGEIIDSLAFSSWRQYGGVVLTPGRSNTPHPASGTPLLPHPPAPLLVRRGEKIRRGEESVIVLAGSPDTFLPRVKNKKEQVWLEALIKKQSKSGKHILCIARLDAKKIPSDLKGASLSVIAVFVFYNNLREGIRDSINFFQNRGVHIRIISGDNTDTARAIAQEAGIKNTDKFIIGKEMEAWSESDFDNKAKLYTIFSRVIPEQKEKIIKALKKNGFTAMIGDGANDALAIKNANLGIAMFEGAPATRQLASVVLINNSFAALPGGVELADTIIINIEILAGIFLNISLVGFFLFVVISLFGFEFPLTPLNITLLDYFTIGLPSILVSYWSIRPSGKAVATHGRSFLKKVLPFTMCSSILQTLAVVAIFFLSPQDLKTAQSNTLVLITFIAVGFIFFIFAPKVFKGVITRAQKIQILALAGIEVALLFFALRVPAVIKFFDMSANRLDNKNILEIFLIVGLFVCAEYILAERMAGNNG